MCNCLEGQIIVAMVIDEDKPQLKDLPSFVFKLSVTRSSFAGKGEGLLHP